MNKQLRNSKEKKHSILMQTSHPDGDRFTAVVLGLSKSTVVFQAAGEFAFTSVHIMPRKWITKVRDGEFEQTSDKVLRFHGEMKKLNRRKWINELTSVKDALTAIKAKGIWPTVETVFDDDNALYLGPITKIKAKTFFIDTYDANGEWEQEYELPYSEIFSIGLFDQYTERFNEYVKHINKLKK